MNPRILNPSPLSTVPYEGFHRTVQSPHENIFKRRDRGEGRVRGGIIAAGEGSRLRAGGIAGFKPMLIIAGFPLVGHVLRNFSSAGIKKVAIIFNSSEQSCVRWVQKNFPGMEIQFIVKSTESSFESFWLVGNALRKSGADRCLISTVDTICSREDFKKMTVPMEGVCLGVTTFVEDEKPVWVKMNSKTNKIISLGGKTGTHVTAGMYGLPASLFVHKPLNHFKSLREYLKYIFQKKMTLHGVPLSQVVDVDTPEDILSAERMLCGD